MNAVEFHGVQQRYGKMTVIHDLNLTLGEGEVLGLFGHNGAGKTTTLKLILGLLQPSAGRLQVLGEDSVKHQVRRQLGYLPENVTFYPQLSGRETLSYFARLKGAGASQVDELLEHVGLAEAAQRRVKTYSKGMRQRLGLAQALLGSPRLLLLDEPTVGLDPIATQELYLLIDRLRQQGTSIILCSHELSGVERHIDRAAILADGHLQALGDLPSLRRAAGLPVRIRLAGLAEPQVWLQRWAEAGLPARQLNGDWLEVSTPPAGKLALLSELLKAEPRDLELRQPSLEDLYGFYMAKARTASAGADA
jgi:Cu-processing system ATP-binding protein